jgi:CRP-like cAMP-binding protein
LSTDELKLVRGAGVLREAAANQVLFKEGDTGDGIYVVTEGSVQITALVGH